MLNLKNNFRSEKLCYVLFVSVVALFAIHLVRLYPVVQKKLSTFVSAQGHYDDIRNREILVHQQDVIDPKTKQSYRMTMKFSAAGSWEAAQMIPQNAVVEIAPNQWNMTKAMARYILYPRKVRDSGQYIVDLHNAYKNPLKGYKIVRLSSGTIVYAKEGYHFVKNLPPKTYHWLQTAFMVMGMAVIYLVTGFLICLLFNISVKPAGILWFMSTSYLSGFFSLNSVSWLIKICGFSFNQVSLLSSWAVFIIIIFLLVFKQFNGFIKNLREYMKSMEVDFKDKFVFCSTFIIYCVLFILFLSIAVSPLLDWDGMLHWGYLAKILSFEKVLNFEYPHLSYYPLLWPFHIAAHFTVFQSAYDGFLSWLMAINFLLFIGQFIGCIKILRVPRKIFWIPLMLFIIYFCKAFFYFSYAEIIFITFELAVMSGLLMWLKDNEEKKFFYLALIMACALSLVKLEGAISAFILICAGMCAYKDKFNFKKLFKNISLFFIPFILIFGWIFWGKFNGYSIPISHIENGVTFTKLQIYFQLLGADIQNIRIERMGLLMILFMTVLLRKTFWNERIKFLFYSFCVLFIFSYLVVLGVRAERLTEMIARATPRLIFHAAPLLCLWWASFFSENQ